MAEGSYQLPPNSTGTVIRTQTNAGVAGGAHQPVVTIADAQGIPICNSDVTIRALAAATATGQSADFINAVGDGAIFFLRVSAISGVSAAIVVKIQGKDPVSGGYYDIPGAAFASQTAVTAAGVALALSVHPGLAVTAGVSANSVLPRTYRAFWTITGTTPNITFSIGANLLLA